MYLEIIILCILIFVIYKLNQRDPLLPPGEWGLPFLGVLPYYAYRGNARKYFYAIKHKYGGIFSVRLGGRIGIFIKDFEIIKEHLNKTELSGRPEMFTYSALNSFTNLGMLFSNGIIWETNRRFTIRHLRKFGFGKADMMQPIIVQEANKLVQNLESNLGEPTEIDESLNICALNVIWQLVASMRLEPGNPRVQAHAKHFKEDLTLVDGPMSILNYYPFLISILPSFIIGKVLKVDKLLKNREYAQQLIREIIANHKETLDPSNPRDFIDDYLIEMETKNELKINFEDPAKNIIMCAHDLFLAGIDTTSISMKWFILLMAVYPEIQEKVHSELDSELQKGEIELLQHRDKLHYLNAVLHETMRFRSVVAFAYRSPPIEDYCINGYKIPKGAIVYCSIEECNRDAKYWEEPDHFHPEHFLNEDGTFRIRTESFVPFLYGKRVCVGESVARMSLFMFAGTVLQKFKISLPEGAEVNLEPCHESVQMNYPHPFKVILQKRNT